MKQVLKSEENAVEEILEKNNQELENIARLFTCKRLCLFLFLRQWNQH